MQNLDFTYDNASGLLQAFSLLARKTAEQEVWCGEPSRAFHVRFLGRALTNWTLEQATAQHVSAILLRPLAKYTKQSSKLIETIAFISHYS